VDDLILTISCISAIFTMKLTLASRTPFHSVYTSFYVMLEATLSSFCKSKFHESVSRSDWQIGDLEVTQEYMAFDGSPITHTPSNTKRAVMKSCPSSSIVCPFGIITKLRIFFSYLKRVKHALAFTSLYRLEFG
jgi:hypothetical protein